MKDINWDFIGWFYLLKVFYPPPFQKFFPHHQKFSKETNNPSETSNTCDSVEDQISIMDNILKKNIVQKEVMIMGDELLINIRKTFEISNIYGFLVSHVNISNLSTPIIYLPLSKICWANFDFEFFYPFSKWPFHTISPSPNYSISGFTLVFP